MNDDQMYIFEPDQMFYVLDEMKACNKLLITCSTHDLCDTYKKLFPIRNDGVYELCEAHINALGRAMFDKAAMELIDKGFMELVWDNENNDFAYKATKAGRDIAKHMERKE